MEKQLEKDLFTKLESYVKNPYEKHSKETLWRFFKDWVGEEYWDELLKTHNQKHNDMGYWFQDFGDFIFAFAENLYKELEEDYQEE